MLFTSTLLTLTSTLTYFIKTAWFSVADGTGLRACLNADGGRFEHHL